MEGEPHIYLFQNNWMIVNSCYMHSGHEREGEQLEYEMNTKYRTNGGYESSPDYCKVLNELNKFRNER